MSNRIARMVPVEILQDDMVGFDSGLAFPVHDLNGKRAFTDKVLWGEIWIADCSKRGMWWAGYVQDGQLFLDQSARNRFLHNRKHSRQEPTLMLTGTYKVWLDAWLRPGDYMYQNDPDFTTDPVDGDGGQWRAPAPPARKYWQEVKITQPGKKGEPCRIRVRSRRFHWLYRVSRLLDLLDHLLLGHEKLIVRVDETRMYADYLREFLDVLMNSGSNLGHMASRPPQLEFLKEMMGVARNVSVHCSNFIDYGVCDGLGDPIPERKHINNVAHLLWALIHEEDFGREVALYDPVLAEEHRILLSRLGSVFNRVPRVFAKAVDIDDRRAIPTGRSFAYGREFAAEFTFPYYNAKLAEAGHAPAFLPEKPASTLKFVNSVRRYGVSMLNAASIFVVKEKLNPAKLLALIEAEEKVWATAASKGYGTLEAASELVGKFRAAGKAAKVEKWSAVRERYLDELAAQRGDLAKLRGEIEDVRKQMEAQPQKIIDRLRVTTPAVVYGVQSLELFVKWAVAVSAWNAFRESAGEEFFARVLKGADAGIKSIDAAGTTLQFLGLHKVLRATWLASGGEAGLVAARLKGLEKAGKGLGALADLGSAVLYTYDLFSAAHDDGLLERYLPEDVCSMHAWHLVTWGGKWFVGVGSLGAYLKSVPIFAKLQAIGYFAQLVGEAGEAFARHGASEHKHFHDVNLEVMSRALRASAAVRERGWNVEFYTPSDQESMARCMAVFDWIPVDGKLLQARLGPPTN